MLKDVLLVRMKTSAYSLMRLTSSKRTEPLYALVELDNMVSTENALHVTQFVPHVPDLQLLNARHV